MTREAILLPWLASQSPAAARRLGSLTGSPAYTYALDALEPRWLAWAIAHGRDWPRARAVALFDDVERLVAEGFRRHDAERLALAAAIADAAWERQEGTAAP